MSLSKPVVFLAFANDKQNDALYLRNLPVELHGLRQALQPAVRAGLCEVVERTAVTINDIFDVFQDPYYKDRIAIFHYGGHASGHNLVLENLDGSHSHSHSEGLVPFFGRQKGLQLVFFNGCSTQLQAQALIEEGVTAVVGTATAIKDDIATDLSTRFYKGLAAGYTIHQSWEQSIDAVKTKTSTATTRGLKLRRDQSTDFPWEMHIRSGAEIVKDWNLPLAVNNPLFGLPRLHTTHDLPDEPYRYLDRYHEEHAEIFFGRGRYIRDLYHRATSPTSSPIILLYGQSGVGKSSMLDSGVLPRLMQHSRVRYLRRDASQGLLQQLQEVIGLSANVDMPDASDLSQGDAQPDASAQATAIRQEIDRLEATLTAIQEPQTRLALERLLEDLYHREAQLLAAPTSSTIAQHVAFAERPLKVQWQSIEAHFGQPFTILLDQVEEVFTKPSAAHEQELDAFLEAVYTIFRDPNDRPLGKLILSYRKEYHPEVEERCKAHQLPREEVFVKQLSKSDIEEVVLGLTSTPRLVNKYHLSVEQSLPGLIADDLLEDKDSPIAPVLQILLTKLWQRSKAASSDAPHFRIADYQQLKKEGLLMGDFFAQQMESLRQEHKEWVNSGLVLDMLNFHVTRLGTADAKSIDEIESRYAHRKHEVRPIVRALQERYLLTDAGVEMTALAHDTLAPLIGEAVRVSDTPGQRAARILAHKIEEEDAYLDLDDLVIVERGGKGMRMRTTDEDALIARSQRRRQQLKRRQLWINRIAVATVIVIAGLSVFSFYQKSVADRQKENALLAKADADSSAVVAQEQRRIALENEHIAAQNAENAAEQARIAEANAKEAESQRLIALRNAAEARIYADSAETNRQQALLNAKRAEQKAFEAEKNAELARKNAEEAKEKAAEAQRNLKQVKREQTKIEAKVIAGNATVLIRDRKYYNAAEAALQAFEKNRAADGPLYASVIYSALNHANESMRLNSSVGHNVWTSTSSLSRDVAMHPTREEVAFSLYRDRDQGQVNVVNTRDKTDQQILRTREEVRHLAYAPNGQWLIASTKVGTIQGWKYNAITQRYEELSLFTDQRWEEGIQAIAFAAPPDQNYFMLAISTGSRVTVYQVGTSGNVFQEVWSRQVTHRTLAFEETGRYLALGTATGAWVYETAFQQAAATWRTSPDSTHIPLRQVASLAWSPNAAYLALGNDRGRVVVYNWASQEPRFEIAEHRARITAMTFSPDGDQLVTASTEGTAKLWNLGRNHPEEDRIILDGSQSPIYDLAFATTGDCVYAISADKEIYRWPTDIKLLYDELRNRVAAAAAWE